jgi:hypothetical protein
VAPRLSPSSELRYNSLVHRIVMTWYLIIFPKIVNAKISKCIGLRDVRVAVYLNDAATVTFQRPR